MTINDKGKGKAIAGKAPAGKRQRGGDDDKTGGGRKRKNRGVLQFFEDSTYVDDDDDSDDSDFGDGMENQNYLLAFAPACTFSSFVVLSRELLRVLATLCRFVEFWSSLEKCFYIFEKRLGFLFLFCSHFSFSEKFYDQIFW